MVFRGVSVIVVFRSLWDEKIFGGLTTMVSRGVSMVSRGVQESLGRKEFFVGLKHHGTPGRFEA